MPSLKQLTCHIERGPTNVPLREYSTVYGDGVVTTFVGIPSTPTPFSIHLTSRGFIANGLAMFVYIDGAYQCNRNRRDLVPPEPGVESHYTNINFRVRQKEIRQGGGQFIAHEWRFEKLDVAAADKPPSPNNNRSSSIGTIEVVVRRCHGEAQMHTTKNVLPPQTEIAGDGTSNLGALFDGTNDALIVNSAEVLPAAFSLDGANEVAAMPGGWSDGAGDDWDRGRTAGNGWSTGSEQADAENPWDEEAAVQQIDAEDEGENVIAVLIQLDGPADKQLPDVPHGIVINQYVGSDAGGRVKRPVPEEQAAQAGPPIANQVPPWQVYSYSPNMSAPTPLLYHPCVLYEFQQFIASKYGFGSANISPLPPGATHPQPVQQVGAGTYRAGEVQPASPTASNHSSNAKTGKGKDNSDWNQAGAGNDTWNQQNDHKDDVGGWNDAGQTGNTNDWGANDLNKDDNAGQDRGGWDGEKNNRSGDGGWDSNDTKSNNGGWDDQNANQNNRDDWNNNNATSNQGGWEPHKDEQTQQAGWESKDENENNATPSVTHPAPAPHEPAKRSRSHASSHRSSKSVAKAVTDFDPSQAYVKPYWATWHESANVPTSPPPPQEPATSSKSAAKQAAANRACTFPSPPVDAVSPTTAETAKLSHRLHPSRGALYTNPVSKPKYIDTFEEPYAVFVFQYRSNKMLEELLGDNLKENDFDRGSYRERMMRHKKEDVIEEVMRLKKSLGYDTDESVGSEIEEREGSDAPSKKGDAGGSKKEDEKGAAAAKSGGNQSSGGDQAGTGGW